MSSKELEIKFRLSDKDLKTLSTWLSKNAQFIAEENHEEYYFDHKEVPFTYINFEGIKDASDYLRLRKEKTGRHSICLKRWQRHPKYKDKYTHCHEYEFEVSDADQAKELLENLGYSIVYPIIKKRKKYMHDVFEIVIDDVKDLGRFIEVELKEDFDNPDKGLQKLYDFLKEIGFEKVRLLERGYLSLMWNPDHDFTVVREL